MLGLAFFKRLVAIITGKTAAERIKAEKASVDKKYELRVRKAETAYAQGNKAVDEEVKSEVEAIENSIALAQRRLVALNEIGAVNEAYKTRINSALNTLG